MNNCDQSNTCPGSKHKISMCFSKTGSPLIFCWLSFWWLQLIEHQFKLKLTWGSEQTSLPLTICSSTSIPWLWSWCTVKSASHGWGLDQFFLNPQIVPQHDVDTPKKYDGTQNILFCVYTFTGSFPSIKFARVFFTRRAGNRAALFSYQHSLIILAIAFIICK